MQKDITIIGRAKSNVDFFIDSSKHKALISRIHARISKTQTECGKNVFKIYDVSLNGTYVNDVKITSEAFLKPGDIVIFGHVQGAGLENGNCYKQADSEFKFVVRLKLFDSEMYQEKKSLFYLHFVLFFFPLQFESFHNTCQKGSCLRNERMDLSTPTSSLLSENSPITKRMLSFKGSDNDHKMLQEYASSAVSSFTKQNESDDDMILDKYTKILPHCCTSNEKTKIIKSPGKISHLCKTLFYSLKKDIKN